MTIIKQSTRRAFATVTAVVLLGLAAAALSALAALFAADYRRTRDARTDAQLRQLLMAGAADVSEKAKAWPQNPPAVQWELAVPDSLSAEGGKVTNQPMVENDQAVQVHVRADFQGRSAGQMLRYRYANGRWVLTDASLDAAPR